MGTVPFSAAESPPRRDQREEIWRLAQVEAIMRPAVGLLLLLLGTLWIGARIDPGYSADANARIIESPWRRTKDGWQRTDDWPPSGLAAAPTAPSGTALRNLASLPNPLLVALLLLFSSLWFLFAFTPIQVSPLR